MEITNKACRVCEVVKSLSEFYKALQVKDGYKATCKECTIKHRKSCRDAPKQKVEEPESNIKIMCECGLEVRKNIHDSHVKTEYHQRRLLPKKDMDTIKKNIFEENKDKSNCCLRCLRINIDNQYFDRETKMCDCCDEIVNAGPRACWYCGVVKTLDMFARSNLTKCKSCAAARGRVKMNANVDL